MFAIRRRLGVGFHLAGITAHAGLSQREGRDLATGHPGQETAFLFLGAEDDQRLRDADGLMSGDERGEIAAETAENHRRAAIRGL